MHLLTGSETSRAVGIHVRIGIDEPKRGRNRAQLDWLAHERNELAIEGRAQSGTPVLLLERFGRDAPLPRGSLLTSKLRRVQDFIEAHLDQPMLLAQLAAAAAVSPFHFHRQFKKTTGMTPQRYIRQIRVERAKALLSTPELPLVEVAARVGFADQSHFTSTFRKVTSMTPRRYRNEMPT